MNEIRVPELLLQRYNTHFLGLVHKLSRPILGTPCCYSNNLATRTLNNNNNMHSPLKLKIQNALNQVIFADAEARGLFVGGRRRNRKKRKNRNGKDKKKQKKQEAKSSPVLVRYNSENISFIGDERPLIESDLESSYSYTIPDNFVDELPPLIDVEEEENLDPENMPFDFFKKSKRPEPEKPKEPEPVKVEPKEEPKKEEEPKTLKQIAVEAPKKEEVKPIQEEIKEPLKEVPPPKPVQQEVKEDKTYGQPPKTEVAPVDNVKEKDGEPSVDGAPKVQDQNNEIPMTDLSQSKVNGANGTESSPLVGMKPLQDTQPGCLCCTIM